VEAEEKGYALPAISERLLHRVPRLFGSLRDLRPTWLPQDNTGRHSFDRHCGAGAGGNSPLAGIPAEAGLIAFIAATVGFVVFGANRVLSAGVDSTIAPIFAGGLAVIMARRDRLALS
jgi:SulP family sulfate permease